MGNLRVARLGESGGDPALPPLRNGPGIRHIADVSFEDDFLPTLRRVQPNVVIVDLRRRAAETAVLVAALRRSAPLASLLVVGAPDALDAARAALQGGAAGYVTRDVSAEAIAEALDAIARGRMHITRSGRTVVKKLLEEAAAVRETR